MAAYESVRDIRFPEMELDMMELWKRVKAFETSLERSVGNPEFTFYDGPPFATGLPHYGHILAGSIKDVVTRYAHQTGHHVTRRFGWDCHGLPIEYEIDKLLNITSPEDVHRIGIGKYNAECRSIVMRYSSEWERVVKRMGRWIDFENDYKTLDPSFMESVWWVFSQLSKKGLVYRGVKVMPYSTTCHTPLSNFESGLNYKDVSDPAVVVKFPILSDDPRFNNVALVAWTTTPWTLPSNLSLCVNAESTYVIVKDPSGDLYLLMKDCIGELYPKTKKKKKAEYDIVIEFPGSELEGLRYEPLFDYFKDETTAFRVVTDSYVKNDSGTGVVHQAPGFGEDDYRVCMRSGIIDKKRPVVCPVNESGCFTDIVSDFAGRYVKEADRDIINHIKEMGRLVRNNQIIHSYPHCWRSDSPLIYKTVPSWFIDVPSIRSKLLENNEQTYWVPGFVKDKRFCNWLKDAREWAVSRNRYWGTPLPIWTSDDGEEIIVVESIEELQQLTGATGITDIHRDKIDHLEIPSRKGKGMLKRVPEVFDCWFESGSMPYAQQHYPFENQKTFEGGFPADFIAEGLDQTRGWFYTLMVISTALFKKPPFKNLVVNGLVLAEDGKKMSKRLKNYPDPMDVVSKHGADALRLYLINSPVVRAESLRFKEEGVRLVVQDIFLPWFNTYRWFVSQARRIELDQGISIQRDVTVFSKTNSVMDKWILSSLQTLIANVRREMESYHLDTVIPHLLTFLGHLSRWYVRFNKGIMKGDAGVDMCTHSLCTLFEVLFTVCRLMSPFTPFFVEYMYQNLSAGLPEKEREDSVHYLMLPSPNQSMVDTDIEVMVSRMQNVVELGRAAREKSGQISFRFPMNEAFVVHRSKEFLNSVKKLDSYIKDELNVKNVIYTDDVDSFVHVMLEPNNQVLGPKLRNKKGALTKALDKVNQSNIELLRSQGFLDLQFEFKGVSETYRLELDVDVKLRFEFKKGESLEGASLGELVVIVNKEMDDACRDEGVAREIISRIQMSRKDAGITIEDKVALYVDLSDAPIAAAAFAKHHEYINAKIRQPVQEVTGRPETAALYSCERKVLDETIRVLVFK